MAVTDTKVIGDYTAAAAIDGSTHYLLIQPGDSSTAYKKISRSVYLGVTGQPADTSTVQNISNKTIGNTNTVTALDTLFTLQDNSDNTKQARFELSGITTATTRTYTLPNASSTLADIATAQTLTNKTLTAPTITNGSITGSTITTDAIIGQSSATSGTIYGLSISSGKVGSNGVVTASITDGVVTPAKLVSGTGSSWSWQTYVPTWANLTLGDGTITAKYIQIGKTVFVRVYLVLGATSAVTGDFNAISLPVTAASYAGSVNISPLGTAIFQDFSTAATAGGVVAISSTTTVSVRVWNATVTYIALSTTSSTVPWTWAVNDELSLSFTYEAA